MLGDKISKDIYSIPSTLIKDVVYIVSICEVNEDCPFSCVELASKRKAGHAASKWWLNQKTAIYVDYANLINTGNNPTYIIDMNQFA